ncbi:MAG: hypothetical protein PHG66_02325 [Candidatus Colwellbacteria bacterium]|nr:hypothetical protein [Candidatus Colwellbacteria bacterium]
MNNKRILLVVALVSIVAVIIGILAYLYFTTPETITGLLDGTTKNDLSQQNVQIENEDIAVVQPVAGDCLFAGQSVCAKAFVPVRKGEIKPVGGLGFFLDQGEVEIIAPTDGYSTIYFKGKNRTDPRVVFTDNDDWTIDYLSAGHKDEGHTFFLYASAWKDVVQGKVKRGDKIGTALIDKEIYSGVFEKKMNFGINISKSWSDRLADISSDPVIHVTYLVGQMNNRMQ